MSGPADPSQAYAALYKRQQEEEVAGSTGVLVQSINHATGQNSWKVMPTDYDYKQELARAAFADMLHDTERNQLYRAGLRAAIRQKRDAGEEVHVLDIGTGTGLLAMMAAVEGADSITACEEFRPMADCAEKVIKLNGFSDQIKLVRKRSTDVQVGPGLDMERRANILVTEVFDTELIGEGAISTYNHAAAELLTADRLVVPGMARVWAQAVSSTRCAAWARPQPLHLGDGVTLEPAVDDAAPGCSLALHDLQLSQLGPDEFTALTPPVVVFQLDLACRDGPIPSTDQAVVTVPALASGSCDAVLMWWDCWTDPANSVLLSCAPSWASHHPPDSLPWRDHWMQAIYYPQSRTVATQGSALSVVACHDEYSLWFDLCLSPPDRPLALPSPAPGLQMAMSRCRLGQVNSSARAATYSGVVRRLLARTQGPATVLCLGEQGLLGLVAARLGAGKVIICCEGNSYMRDYITRCAEHNGIADKISLVEASWLTNPPSPLPTIDAVIAEPHYSSAVLPWHNLLFWFSLSSLALPPTVTIAPSRARLLLLPMAYTDLWKIRSPLGSVEGFKMDHFDDIVMAASHSADQEVEPQPLWEYPGTALALPTQVVVLDLKQGVPTGRSTYTGSITLHPGFSINGLALWMDWQLDDTTAVSSGPVSEVVPGERVQWDPDSKQAVHLLPAPVAAVSLSYSVTFHPAEGDFTFQFQAVT